MLWSWQQMCGSDNLGVLSYCGSQILGVLDSVLLFDWDISEQRNAVETLPIHMILSWVGGSMTICVTGGWHMGISHLGEVLKRPPQIIWSSSWCRRNLHRCVLHLVIDILSEGKWPKWLSHIVDDMRSGTPMWQREKFLNYICGQPKTEQVGKLMEAARD